MYLWKPDYNEHWNHMCFLYFLLHVYHRCRIWLKANFYTYGIIKQENLDQNTDKTHYISVKKEQKLYIPFLMTMLIYHIYYSQWTIDCIMYPFYPHKKNREVSITISIMITCMCWFMITCMITSHAHIRTFSKRISCQKNDSWV